MPTRANESSKQAAHALDAATCAALDGESLPEFAARDEARLLVQSPHRLFFYWSFARNPWLALRRALGDLTDEFRLRVRLIDLEDEAVVIYLAARTGELWFDARPHHSYRAEVGFYAERFPFVRALISNVVRTPTDAISDVTDNDAAFQIGTSDLSLLLTTPGFQNPVPSDATQANAATLVSPVSSFSLTSFAPSSFVLGVAAPERQD